MTPTQRAVINAVAAVEKEVRARAHTPKLRFDVFSTTDKVLLPFLPSTLLSVMMRMMMRMTMIMMLSTIASVVDLIWSPIVPPSPNRRCSPPADTRRCGRLVKTGATHPQIRNWEPKPSAYNLISTLLCTLESSQIIGSRRILTLSTAAGDRIKRAPESRPVMRAGQLRRCTATAGSLSVRSPPVDARRTARWEGWCRQRQQQHRICKRRRHLQRCPRRR